jgi:hypothetical protein
MPTYLLLVIICICNVSEYSITMSPKHDDRCPCCECTLHNGCPTVHTPNWTTIMPMKINEIVFGPVDLLPDNCLYEIRELFSSQFIIIQKYVYPDNITRMITIPIVSRTPIILKPRDPIALLCIIHLDNVINNIQGKNMVCY